MRRIDSPQPKYNTSTVTSSTIDVSWKFRGQVKSYWKLNLKERLLALLIGKLCVTEWKQYEESK